VVFFGDPYHRYAVFGIGGGLIATHMSPLRGFDLEHDSGCHIPNP